MNRFFRIFIFHISMLYLWRMKTLHNIAVFSFGFSFGLYFFALATLTVQAALPIDLEIATEQGAPITAQQEWARVLGRMNLGTVRLRGARPGDRPSIKAKQSGKVAPSGRATQPGRSTRYHLVAILSRRNELVLPGRRFRLHDQQALKKHFEQLPAQAAYTSEDRGRFGLTEKQFRQVFAELSQPVGVSTLGKTAADLLAHLEVNLSIPVRHPTGVWLRHGKPLTMELQKFTAGTALAYALRREGLALWPEQLPGQSLRLTIARYHERDESWPIGWKPAVSSRKSAPQLYEFRDIEINGFTLAQALTALQPALQLPVLLDDWLLAERDIAPSKVQVTVKKRRRSLKSALSRMLSQAKLSEEVRVDEQELPFLWVTRFGENSRPAVK